MPGSVQARCYSSGSGNDDNKQPSSEDADSALPSGLASAFGFQSLSSLVEQPKRGRYSSPREPEQETGTANASDVSETRISADAGVDHYPRVTAELSDQTEPATSRDDRTPSTEDSSSVNARPTTLETDDRKPTISDRGGEASTYLSAVDASTPAAQRNQPPVVIGEAFRKRFATNHRQITPNGRREASRSNVTSRRLSGFKSTVEQDSGIPGEPRRANPFLAVSRRQGINPRDYKRVRLEQAVSPHSEKPWGMSEEDQASVNSFLEPETNTLTSDVEATRTTDTAEPSVKEVASFSSPKAITSEARSVGSAMSGSRTQSQRNQSSTTESPNAKLTHVTSSGEAHMVDVGAKEDTHRIAVATAIVMFSNAEPFRLISENNNKKGDVLGIARIAGIMAAKRTSDLIPLCHPIAINRVDLDVKLHAPRDGEKKSWLPKSQHGFVMLQAQVECNGPTGVEMEALTAATGAALTVYDMCKAVDKSMAIHAAKVVYKAGGRSGLYAHPSWSRAMGINWFTERGLEVPRWMPRKPAAETNAATVKADNSAVASTTQNDLTRTLTTQDASQAPPSKSLPASSGDQEDASGETQASVVLVAGSSKPLIRRHARHPRTAYLASIRSRSAHPESAAADAEQSPTA